MSEAQASRLQALGWRLGGAILVALLLATGAWLLQSSRSSRSEAREAQVAQCAVRYALVLRQLVERSGQARRQSDSVLLTQLQIQEGEDCGGRRLVDALKLTDGIAPLLPLLPATDTAEGQRQFDQALSTLFAALELALRRAEVLHGVHVQALAALPLLAPQPADPPDPALLQHLSRHIAEVERDLASAVRLGPARDEYLTALRDLAGGLERRPDAVMRGRARALSSLYRLYDAAALWQNGLLQARIVDAERVRQLAWIGAGLLGLLLLLAFGVGFAQLAADRRKRLRDLVELSQRTGRGELGLSVQVGGGDSMAELGRAFNQMTAELRASYEKIIRELEAALAGAKAAERVKSDFLHNVSHEIRTPINAILGMSHLALQTPLQPRQREYLATVNTQAKQLMGLVNGILDFSRLEKGELRAESAEFDLADVLEPLAGEWAAKAQAKGLEFRLEWEPAQPRGLVGDAAKLQQLLGLYLDNAVKYTARGYVALRVVGTPRSGGHVDLRFTVSDSGIGIAPDLLARLFTQIQQGDGSATRSHGGTGLGLVICQKLAGLLGGTVGVKSTAGASASFWFALGLPLAPDRVLRSLAPVAAPAARPAASDAPPARAFDPGLLQRLEDQVAAFDTAAEDSLAELRQMAGADPRLTDALGDQLAAFDFAAAAETLPALRRAFRESPAPMPPPAAPVDVATLLAAPVLDALQQQIGQFDSESAERAAALCEALGGQAPVALRALRSALEGFDFDAAAGHLAELRQALSGGDFAAAPG